VAKKTSDSMLVKAATKVGRTLGRVARGVDRVKAVGKKSAKAKAGAKKRPKDPAVAAKRAKVRASWKSLEDSNSAVAHAQQGALVDERALVRATTGKRWAARKPR